MRIIERKRKIFKGRKKEKNESKIGIEEEGRIKTREVSEDEKN